jgi:hypothetical protein
VFVQCGEKDHQDICAMVRDWETLQKEHSIGAQALASQRSSKMALDPTSLLSRSKHVTKSQKRCWMLDIISQNQTFIFLLPFKTIGIMAS